MLVNGTAEAADGMRAAALIGQLPPEWKVTVAYRTSKLKSIFRFLSIAFRLRPDVVIVIKMAYTGVIAGLLSKLLLRCALISDTGDAAYALARSTGRYSRVGLLAIWLVEKCGSYGSDWIVTRGSYHKQLLAEWGIRSVTVIPDGVDTSMDLPQDGSLLRDELGLTGRFVLGIVGSLEWSEKHRFCYGWDVIEAVSYLRDLPVSVLIVGDGSGRKQLEQRAMELEVSSCVHFVGTQPYRRLGEFLAVMDVCVSTQSSDIVGMVRTTGKIPLYLAHDKFVIATNVGEARRVLPGVGLLLPYSGVKDVSYPVRLAQAVRDLATTPERVHLAGAARRVAVEEFDYPMLGKRLLEVIHKAVRAAA